MSSSRTEGRQAGATQLVEVVMPQMGVSVAEGTILEWRKHPGDWVEADETVCDVTTDKVDVEIPSPAGGRLERILTGPGETVPVGTPIAVIDTGARAGEAHPAEDSSGAAAGPVLAAAGPVSPHPHSGPPLAARRRGAPREPPAGEADRSAFYSPVVRRIAERAGVDLGQVEGHGVGGRIRKRDLLAYINRAGSSAARPGPARSAQDEVSEKPLHIESPYRPEAPAPAGNGAPSLQATAGRREPMSPMRQAIAKHMVESRRTAAHCTTIVEVDFSRVAARRAELKDAFAGRGVNLTYLAFVAEATVAALQRFPALNASVDGDGIVYHDDVNLGIAVALDDGLIVPVIPKAQRLSLEGLAAAIADLAARARSKDLHPDEVHGGTFTITNPGQFGAVLATPIINQPQVAILDLEAVVKRPVVVEGPEGDAVAIRPMAYLCMSWDHRALDGAEASRFLGAIKDGLEGMER